MKKKIITIIGARPQFIKAAPLSREFNQSKNFEEHILHTGQHYDVKMSDIFFQELRIPKPSYNLNISGGSHGQMTGQMIIEIERFLDREKPDIVLVYGDTNTTLAGALSAAKMRIPLVHVEAGLRSYNRKMPEEINRLLTDHVCDVLFCPSKNALDNLRLEGVTNNVFDVGDIMFDAFLFAKDLVMNNADKFEKKFSFFNEKFLILTIHREEATRNLSNFLALYHYAHSFSKEQKCKIIFPAHPRLKWLLKQVKVDSRVIIIDPVSYFELQYLLTKACYVLTDSGGLQKEAFYGKVPCITLRKETEWKETVESGWNKLWQEKEFLVKKDTAPYGKGGSAKEIISILDKIL